MCAFSYVPRFAGQSPPENAVEGGFDHGPSYHARGSVSGFTIPGKAGVVKSPETGWILKGACFPYGSKEHRINSFEVLTTDHPDAVSYVLCKTGDFLPKNAVEGGFDDGPLYHARGSVSAGKTIPGKAFVEESPEGLILKGASFPYGSKEHHINPFEVLMKVEAEVIKNVKFDVPRGKVLSATPKVIAQQELANNTSSEQTMTFAVNKKVINTSTFTHKLGVSVKAGVSFECGLPLVVGGKITTDVGGSYLYTWGKSETIEEHFTATIPVRTNPKSIVRCIAKVTESKLEVPYTIYYVSGKTSSGIWRGVSNWNLQAVYDEYVTLSRKRDGTIFCLTGKRNSILGGLETQV